MDGALVGAGSLWPSIYSIYTSSEGSKNSYSVQSSWHYSIMSDFVFHRKKMHKL